jgi:predicted lipid-binding transport protein (Tim44 family)
MYSSALFEIVIFGLIAFVLITKLLEMLGQEDGNDKSKSFFGEPKIRNVTPNSEESGKASSSVYGIFASKIQNLDQYKNLIVEDASSKLKIINELKIFEQKLNNFKPVEFVGNAKRAFIMTVEAVNSDNYEMLEHLIDKRFLDEVQNAKYYSFQNATSQVNSAKICEVYSFGNSLFIKIRFELNGSVFEEWCFTKNVLDSGPAWKISSINAA